MWVDVDLSSGIVSVLFLDGKLAVRCLIHRSWEDLGKRNWWMDSPFTESVMLFTLYCELGNESCVTWLEDMSACSIALANDAALPLRVAGPRLEGKVRQLN